MPSVTHDGQSFSIDGRRLWLVGATLQYARIPMELWADRIAAVKQAGFNTVLTSCPWMLHEPRQDRFDFTGQADLRRFVELCGNAGLRVILRPGPSIGDGFDGGGLPSWLMDIDGMTPRESNSPFLERVTLHFRRLFSELNNLYATTGGPIILVQCEHAWLCSNPTEAERYLREITRMIRESGVTVPVINANDLWQDPTGTIDTWRGWDNLLANLRQLRGVQPSAPLVVSSLDVAGPAVWGAAPAPAHPPDAIARHMAQVLAAGAQPIVAPFHGGTNFGFLGGRLAGGPDRFVTTAAAAHAPLGEAGARGEAYLALKRLATFGHVFAELDADYQPVTLDVADQATAHAVVPLRGSGGRIAFVFGDRHQPATPRRGRGKGAADQPLTLLLEDGVRMPVSIGSHRVGWFLFDADLHGSGRLDYCNLSPLGMVDRAILVLFGPEDARAFLSIDGNPLEATVPGHGVARPLVIEHKGLTIVICNEQQIDTTYLTDTAVHVGAAGLDGAGKPIAATGFPKIATITRGAAVSLIAADEAAGATRTLALADWRSRHAQDYADGESPRYATLDGPQPLTRCGASTGYGWYRVRFKNPRAARLLLHWPDAGDRLHLYQRGELVHLLGFGPGAERGPFHLKVAGEQTLAILADNLGRFSEGNDTRRHIGVHGHAWEVKPLSKSKPKIGQAAPVDPFELRGFIAGGTFGQISSSRQLIWTFTHTRKTPLLIDVDAAAASGTLILNDTAIAYHPGATASGVSRIMVLAEAEETPLKRGKNVLRFAPDIQHEDALSEVAKATTVYECVRAVTESGTWAFAKWQPPAAAEFTDGKPARGVPCWWRTTFATPRNLAHTAALWLDVAGLSKGQVQLNGANIGRYFTATATHKAVGPQTRLFLPAVWLRRDAPNEIILFDEHGFEPSRVKLTTGERGDLD
jgi:Glycosyl hydrolases family 35/Beta-galactosidase jelly roll domain